MCLFDGCQYFTFEFGVMGGFRPHCFLSLQSIINVLHTSHFLFKFWVEKGVLHTQVNMVLYHLIFVLIGYFFIIHRVELYPAFFLQIFQWNAWTWTLSYADDGSIQHSALAFAERSCAFYFGSRFGFTR